jgi:predicted RNA methylase
LRPAAFGFHVLRSWEDIEQGIDVVLQLYQETDTTLASFLRKELPVEIPRVYTWYSKKRKKIDVYLYAITVSFYLVSFH